MTRGRRRGIWIVLILLGLAASPAYGSTSLTRNSSFAYDATSGLLTQTVIEPGQGNDELDTAYTYDAYGNKTEVTVSGPDIATRSSTTAYDAEGRFPVTVTNALGQSTSQAFDPRFGTITSQTGPNGNTTTWQYDSLGRKTLEVRPDGTETSWSYALCSGVSGGTASCPQYGAYQVTTVVSTTAAPGTPIAPTVTKTYDSLGRAIQTDTQGFDGSDIRQTTQYNATGQMAEGSRPYFASGGTPVYTQFSYDTLGRPVKRTAPDGGVTTWTYDGLTTSVTNPLGQTTTTTKNSQGKAVSVTDAANNTSTFAYDPFGDLVSATDPAGNTTTASYDIRGFKTSETDPDMGTWTYAYNALGELTSQTDAKDQTTTLSYDLLGRMTQRVAPDMTGSWTYDTAAHGIGKLASASSSAGYERSYSYDSLSRPAATTFTYSGTAYAIDEAYDADGRLSQVTYPDGYVVDYGYNATGYLSELSDNATGAMLWQATTRDAALQLTGFSYGNGVATTRSYDADTGRLLGITAVNGGGTTVQQDTYQWDLGGNLTARDDAVDNVSETFQYDSLDRLTQTAVAGGATVTMGYSADGNITSKSDVGTYTYGSQPNAVTAVSGIGTTYSYDADGNLTSATENGAAWRSLTWTSANRPASITEGNVTYSYLYGPEDQRFEQVGPDGTRLYFDGGGVWAEHLDAAGTGQVTWSDYLVVPGEGMIGVRSDPVGGTVTIRWYGKDNLGSVVLLTDESGNAVETDSYDAWGARRYPNGTANDGGLAPSATIRGFAGQEQIGIGLVDMNARFYDPQIGRFMSADPVGGSATDPQSFNPYAYVGDNPLSLTDPTGLCFLGCFWHSTIFKAVVAIAVAVTLQYEALPYLAGDATGFAAAAHIAASTEIAFAGVSGAAAGAITTGTWQGALLGAASAVTFYGIGHVTTPWMTTTTVAPGVAPDGVTAATMVTTTNYVGVGASAVVHGLAGGVISVAEGQNFQSGFLSAGVSALAAPFTATNQAVAGMEETVIGGASSVLGGGKFANGAVTAAFSFLYDNCLQGNCLGAESQQQSATGNDGREIQVAQEVVPFTDLTPFDNFLSVRPPLAQFPQDPTVPPGEGWIWKGAPGSQPGDPNGSWWNPSTGESLHPDLNHEEGVPPHYDYKLRKPTPDYPNKPGYRWFPDGTMQPKA